MVTQNDLERLRELSNRLKQKLTDRLDKDRINKRQKGMIEFVNLSENNIQNKQILVKRRFFKNFKKGNLKEKKI